LRVRFQRTFRAVKLAEQGLPHGYDVDDLISFDSASIPKATLAKILQEISQPTYSHSAGKILVDKAPDGTRSPNHADAVNILFAPRDVSYWDMI
jgi:hypothetical protein